MESISALFVLPSKGGGGGANSVVQEVLELVRLGVNARVATNAANYVRLLENYPEFETQHVPVLAYGSVDELARHMRQFRVVVATTNASVYDVHQARSRSEATEQGSGIRCAYYVQDYEPLFYPPDSDRWSKAYRSYTHIPDAVLFAKTQWLCDIVEANHGIKVAKIEPSLDHSIYYPGPSRCDSPLSVVAMMRPSTARRAPRRTLRILDAIASRFGGVSMQVFGAGPAELARFGITLPTSVRNWGVLKRTEVPPLLRSADMFLDLSDYQAFGRTALEGMASGCIPIVPILGGAPEIAEHGRNAFVVDTRSDEEILAAVTTFVSMSGGRRAEMRQAALAKAADFTVTKSALSELRLFTQMADSGVSGKPQGSAMRGRAPSIESNRFQTGRFYP